MLRVWGVVDVLLGITTALAVWLALPVRYWPVDLVASVTALALVVAGVGLIASTRWSRWVARVVVGLVALCGMTVVTLLAVSAAHLAGLYGPVGRGGALVLVIAVLVLVPYFVALPVWQLAHLVRRSP